EALGGAVNLLDPDVVVVSGSVAESGALWWDALRAGFADSAMALTRAIPLLPGELGGAAPLIGAAVAAAQVIGEHACPQHPSIASI
ncbi:ROK family protein, partial [Bifidobacterium gallicum]